MSRGGDFTSDSTELLCLANVAQSQGKGFSVCATLAKAYISTRHVKGGVVCELRTSFGTKENDSPKFVKRKEKQPVTAVLTITNN